jgi:nicotinamidase-related amidase
LLQKYSDGLTKGCDTIGFPFIPGKEVTVPEIEYKKSVKLPVDKTALVVIDMQNDFVKKAGNLYVEAAEESLPHVSELLERARRAGVKIAFTQDTQVEGDPEFDIWPKHCVKGTRGWQIVDELKPRDNELICVKNRYDGFYGSWLDHFLSNIWGVKHVVIVGTVANICVAHTAASAGLRWFHIVIPANGISAMTEFDQALTLRQASSLYAGDVVRDVADIQFTS